MGDLAVVHPAVGAALGLLAGLVVWRIAAELARARDLAPLRGAAFWIMLSGVFGGLALWRFGVVGHGAALTVLGALAATVIPFDIAYRRIPDELSLAIALVGLADAWGGGRLVPALAAGLGGAALLWAASALYGRLRGREGLGLGDVKLTVGLGFWLGPVGLVWCYMGASVATIVAVLAVRLRGPLADDPPFAPGLLIAALAILLAGLPAV